MEADLRKGNKDMDIITYALCKKIAAGAVSGISDLTVHEQNLNITLNNGQVLTMHFPSPTEFSISNCYIREDNHHLIMTFSDGEIIDCGEVPFVNGLTPDIDPITKTWKLGSVDTGYRATTIWEAI